MVNTVLGKFDSRDMGLTVNIILWLVLFITAIAVFVPFYPAMPSSGIDSSWVFGMNQAVAQGLAIGSDIIFTFGPYASIYTKSYHPSTDFMMVSGSLYLALSYSVCFGLLMRSTQWYLVLAVCAVLAGLIYTRDPLFFSLPLLVAVLSFKILFSEEGRLFKRKSAVFYVALMFAPLGLLPLIKGSLLILCGSVVVLCSLFFIANKRKHFAIACLLSPLILMLFFWIAAGQSLIDLPSYFINISSIASGYTQAMALDGKILEVILYLIASVFLLLAITIQNQITNTSKVFLFCIYFLFLFISFKAGFVRHDEHANISGTDILIGALLFPFIIKTRLFPLVIVSAIFSWSLIDGHYNKTTTQSFAQNFKSTYSVMWFGIKNRIQNKNWPRVKYEAAVKLIREQASFPVLQGTTDIYSYNQSYVIASGNLWSPRPIFQSYSAYTTTLVEANKKHLLGDKSPDNIFFKVEPIDQRIPSIEDGASWPVLLSNYQPTEMVNGYLLLQKKPDKIDFKEPLPIERKNHKFGESVILPSQNQLLFAKIEIKPTLLGRIIGILFKPSQLDITFELENNRKKQYIMLAGMAEPGFLLSPLIENVTEFSMLYARKEFLANKLVKSIIIAPHNGRTLLWKDDYTITLSQIKLSDTFDVSRIIQLAVFDDDLSDSKVIMADKCDGNIDSVNGTPPSQATFPSSAQLMVSGWLAVSVDKAALPEAIYVVVTDAQGKRNYLKTHVETRPDVGAYFKKPELSQSGFSTIADISALEGQYTLGLAMKESGTIKLCPQFNIPATISK